MEKLKEYINRSLAIVMLMVLSLISFNQSYYGHYHQLSNGRTIYHAHPYQQKDNSFPLHQHNTFELFFYQQVTDLLWILLIIAGFKLISDVSFKRVQNNIYSKLLTADVFARQNKSPPYPASF